MNVFALNVITTQPSWVSQMLLNLHQKHQKHRSHLLALSHSLSLFFGSSHPERGHQNIVKVLVAILGIGKFGINEHAILLGIKSGHHGRKEIEKGSKDCRVDQKSGGGR